MTWHADFFRNNRWVMMWHASVFRNNRWVMMWHASVFRNNRWVMTGHFLETASGPGKPYMYCTVPRLHIPCPSSCFPASRSSLPICNSASTLLADEVKMAPKRKASSLSAAVIPPIDPNSQLPFAGNHMSVVSKSDLLHLVSIGVLPPKELCSWWICCGVTVPTEDTHEFVVYVPFLLRSLALPISPFFRGLLDFYRLNLTHLNPNSILQISIFVHLCEAFLGVLPHFGLWKYLYHCCPGMAGGQHQLVGGASLEMRRGRKTDYLDIPLKDSIKGWRLEWFIMENHGNSLPPWSGRQPNVHTLSWTESPTDQEVAEAGALLAEVGLLKERGLTAEAVVADFVFKNIQPLKDRAYPSYLYRGLADSTRVTDRRIPAVDLVNWLEMILRGNVSNVGAPVAYSAWNLPPSKAFTYFVSSPSSADGGLGLRVRPSAKEVSALVALLGEIPDDERQVHFEVPLDPSDAEIGAMLDMLAGDSSDVAPAETLVVVPIHEADKALDAQKPINVRPKRSRRVDQASFPAEGEKKKKRRLRQVSSLDQGAGPSAPVAEEVPVPEFTEADPNGCSPSNAEPNGCTVCLADDNGEEEDEIPLIRKNSCHYTASGESSGVPSLALFALIGLQELSLANFDQTLEDMIPEDLLSEPADGGAMDVCVDVIDAGLGSSRAASRASSTLERGLEGQEAGLDSPAPMEVIEGPSALEAAAAENSAHDDGASLYPAPEGAAGDDPAQMDSASYYPAPEGAAGDDPARMGSASYDPAPEGAAGDDPTRMGSASYDPAPEGVGAGSPSCTSMDVHVGSTPPHSGCVVTAQAFGQGVALEASVPDDKVLGSADVTELVPAESLQVAPSGDPLPSHQLISHDLGVASFFSNFQVFWFLLVRLLPKQVIILRLVCFLMPGVGR
jgi:hypothetical protein